MCESSLYTDICVTFNVNLKLKRTSNSEYLQQKIVNKDVGANNSVYLYGYMDEQLLLFCENVTRHCNSTGQ
jgi:hypothetical protein